MKCVSPAWPTVTIRSVRVTTLESRTNFYDKKARFSKQVSETMDENGIGNESFSESIILKVMNEDILSKIEDFSSKQPEEFSKNGNRDIIVKKKEVEAQLPVLTLRDIFNDDCVTVVDDTKTLEYFHNTILHFKEYHEDCNDRDDMYYITRCWGVDCEWKR